MDVSRRNPFRTVLTAAGDRRDLLRGLAAVPLIGGLALTVADADARRQKHVADERKKKKKKTYCLNGTTVTAKNRKKKRKLRRQGATPGKCPGPNPNCVPDALEVTCEEGCLRTTNNCGETVNCGFVNAAPVTTFETQIGLGTQGSGANQLYNPYAVTLTADQLQAFIGDYSNNRISVWSRPNANSTNWTPSYQFSAHRPADVALSANELTLYVADYGNSNVNDGLVLIFTRPDIASQVWTQISTFALGANPNSVTLSPDELTIWTTIFYPQASSQVQVWTRPDTSTNTWTQATTLGSYGTGNNQFQKPGDVAVSADALTIFIADYNNYRISIWTRPDAASQAWSFLTSFGNYGPNSDSDQFYRPISVTLSKDEQTIWIGDSWNNRLAVWSRQNTSTQTWTYLSTFGSTGSGPNNFKRPGMTWVSPDEKTIFVGDSQNNRVSVFSQTCPA